MQRVFHLNALYYVFKLNVIDINLRTYNTQNQNKFMIQTFKILKPSRNFAKVGLDLLNNALDNILNNFYILF